MASNLEGLFADQILRTVSPPSPVHQASDWDWFQQSGFQERFELDEPSSVFIQRFSYDPYTQTQPTCDCRGQLRALRQHYVVEDGAHGVEAFLADHPMAFALLMDAVKPLKAAFGEHRLHIRLQESDDDTLIKVAVQLPADFPEAESALGSFDRTWWLNNCQRSNGLLVFDFELQDGV